MKTRRIGSLEVSVVGLGANNFGTEFFGKSCRPDEAARVIHTALDHGVNFIDTAEEYSVATSMGTGHSEEYIGMALGRRRSEVIIANGNAASWDLTTEEFEATDAIVGPKANVPDTYLN